MSPPTKATEEAKLNYFAVGEIDRRLRELDRQLEMTRATTDSLEPWREAASVLAVVDPTKLHPTRVKTGGTGSGLDLLPELVPVTDLPAEASQAWTMPTLARKKVLRRLGDQQRIADALAANPERSVQLLQRMFDRVVLGRALLPLTEIPGEELSALLTIIDWLEGIPMSPPLPYPYEVRQALEARHEIDRLQRLVGNDFVGRERELDLIRRHIAGNDRTILFLSGPGGVGKSALLAKALLELTEGTGSHNRWVRVDMFDSTVDPRKPESIFAQAATQLARRDPSLERIVKSIIQRIASLGASTDRLVLEAAPDPLYGLRIIVDEFLDILHFSQASPTTADDVGDRLIFCVDTFEEAQFLGELVSRTLLDALALLAHTEIIRIIVSGRGEPQDSLPLRRFDSQEFGGANPDGPSKHASIRLLTVPDLPAGNAARLLSRLLANQSPGLDVMFGTLLDVADAIGGNPLTLQLAAALIAKEGLDVLGDVDKMQTLCAEATQQRLYSRILSHIHNSDVRKLAIPGLVCRLINKDVIREILAEPCGLGKISDDRAKEILEELAREATLVVREPGESLRHRADVRRVMLEGMPAELAEQVRAIDGKAAEYWSRQDSDEARAEELYHRLRLNEDVATLDVLWKEPLAKLLRSALDEFKPGSPARTWLANKLAVVLPSGELSEADIESQEDRMAMAATHLLASGRTSEALESLGSGSVYRHGSPLYGIKARAQFRLGQNEQALVTIEDGIHSAHTTGRLNVVADLLLLKAYVLESEGREQEALDALERITSLSVQSDDVIPYLLARARRARVLRKLDQTQDAHELVNLANVHRLAILGSKALLREFAAEIGSEEPVLLSNAIETFAPDMFERMSQEQLYEFIRKAGLSSERDLAHLTGTSSTELAGIALSMLSQNTF